MPAIALLGTFDTKLEELLRLRHYLEESDATSVLMIDVGRTPSSHPAITHSLDDVLARHPDKAVRSKYSDLQHLSRQEIIDLLIPAASALVASLNEHGKIGAIVSAGGSTGTSLATAVMRHALPIGFPKFMISTIASGDVGPLVEEADMTMMYSVVDIAGQNQVLDTIFQNAAGAVVGMAAAWERRQQQKGASMPEQNTGNKGHMKVGISMFGVTTACVDQIRKLLAELSASPSHGRRYEVLVFHSTGHGGRALERLIAAGQIDAVIDLTLTEISDFVVGGTMSAGSERLTAALKRGIPTVLSVGACDMVNFGPRATVPEEFVREDNARTLFQHNPSVTLMRTNAEECSQVAEFIVRTIRAHSKVPSKVRLLLPIRGTSALAVQGAAFYDDSADEALFRGLEEGLTGSGVLVLRSEAAINDSTFSSLIVNHVEDIF